MQNSTSEMQECIQNALDCHATCLTMLSNHCLEAGGKHVEPKHFKLMLDCAQICQVSADFMLRKSDHHKHICTACAESCDAVGDMQTCADACRKCAATCGAMAKS